MAISIRRATEDDADALFDLAKDFSTSFTPDRTAFETALTKSLRPKQRISALPKEMGRSLDIALASTTALSMPMAELPASRKSRCKSPCAGRGVGKALMENFEE